MPDPTPRLVERPALVLAGMSFYGDPFTSYAGWTEENEIGRLWQRLCTYLGSERSPFPPPTVTYEVHVRGEESVVTGEFEVFAGFEAPGEHPDLPVELSLKVVPAGWYVEVDLRVAEVVLGNPVPARWMQASGYREAGPYFLMRYDERFHGMDAPEDSELTFLMPVRAATGTDEPA